MATKKAIDLTYRVLKLPQPLLQSVRTARDEKNVTNQFFVESSLNHLRPLLSRLRDLGFLKNRGKTVAVRLPFSDKKGTLATLRKASNEVGIPAMRLLEICLASEVAAKMPGRSKQKGGRKTQAKKQKRTPASD